MSDILQIVGAVLILSGFASVQAGWLDPARLPYLIINAAGAGILAVLAYQERQWGFVLLEGTWSVVSIVGIARLTAGRLLGHDNAGPRGPATPS